MSRQHTFVVERYLPRLRAADVELLAERLAAATEDLRAEGREISWLHSLALPDDETCLCIFAATTRADVEEANRRAAAAFERILTGIEIVGVSMTRDRTSTRTIGDVTQQRRNT